MTKESHSKYYSQIGAIGGRARLEKHGNPGTIEGRSKGGHNALLMHQQNHLTKFKIAKKIDRIKRDEILAEFLGVLFGDGHVGEYQTTITLDAETDIEYIGYLVGLIEENFKIIPALRKRKLARAVEICISSVAFSKLMVHHGMVSGNKIKSDFRIPQWIITSPVFLKAFIRGLFDTDGSVYLERKKVKGKTYVYRCLIITSASESLRADIVTAFRSLNFSPTNTTTQQSVFLRKKADVKRYFVDISSHNSKHSVRYAMFTRRCG